MDVQQRCSRGARFARLLWPRECSDPGSRCVEAKVHHRASGERMNGKLALLRPRLSAQKQLNLLIHPKAQLASIGPFLTALPVSLAHPQVLNQGVHRPSFIPLATCPPSFHHILTTISKMAARPQNIGIKAIELYFPSQASLSQLRGHT